MTTAQAIAQALLRCATRVREYEAANEPHAEEPLAQRRAGRRSAAREIAAWLEDVAKEYKVKGADE